MTNLSTLIEEIMGEFEKKFIYVSDAYSGDLKIWLRSSLKKVAEEAVRVIVLEDLPEFSCDYTDGYSEAAAESKRRADNFLKEV